MWSCTIYYLCPDIGTEHRNDISHFPHSNRFTPKFVTHRLDDAPGCAAQLDIAHKLAAAVSAHWRSDDAKTLLMKNCKDAKVKWTKF